MELQWPLILFTTFLAASAGLFATQSAYALAGRGQNAQKPSLVTSLVLLVVGGIAVFMHLQHWERIFNGFGHLSSGITQELIAIVVMFVLMVVYFVMLRRNEGVPKAVAVLAIIAACALVLVMGHSYMMASRPAWNSILQVLSLIGAAATIGVGLFVAFDKATEDAENNEFTGKVALIGSAAGLVTTLIYLFGMSTSTSAFTQVGTYFDPTHPNKPIVDVSTFSPFASGNMPYSMGAIVLAIAAVCFAFAGKKTGNWKVFGWLIAACGLVAAILLRAVFYQAGGSVFLFF